MKKLQSVRPSAPQTQNMHGVGWLVHVKSKQTIFNVRKKIEACICLILSRDAPKAHSTHNWIGSGPWKSSIEWQRQINVPPLADTYLQSKPGFVVVTTFRQGMRCLGESFRGGGLGGIA